MHLFEDGVDTFKDIAIIGVDQDRTRNPDPSRAIYDVHLCLSDTAPTAWSRLFNEARSYPRHSMWRRAWCSGNHIVIQCPLDELEKHHLSYLKEDVATANKGYRELIREDMQQKQQRAKDVAQERDRVNKALGHLKFE